MRKLIKTFAILTLTSSTILFQNKSMSGDFAESFVRIADCPVKCLLVDNLVRLTYHADPKPTQHRSQQICTLPMTVKGIPDDSDVFIEWHAEGCSMHKNCPCKEELPFHEDSYKFPITIQADEDKMLKKFANLCNWGMTSVWEQLVKNKEFYNLLVKEENDPAQSCKDPQVGTSSNRVTALKGFIGDGDLDISFASMYIESSTDDDSDDASMGSDVSGIFEGISEVFGVTDDSFPSGPPKSPQDPCEDLTRSAENDSVQATDVTNSLEMDFDLFTLLTEVENDSVPDLPSDADLEAILSTFDSADKDPDNEKHLISSFSKIIQEMSVKSVDEKMDLSNGNANTCTALSDLKFEQSPKIAELVRHPPPASGRDDDIEKLQQILDDVMIKSGQRRDISY